ncbi:MAG: hypothetical protein ABI767_05570 [Rhodanobacter sp.]
MPSIQILFLEEAGSDALPLISDEVMDQLLAHLWPGHIRQWRHVLSATASLWGDHGQIESGHPAREIGIGGHRPVNTSAVDAAGPLRTVERDALLHELECMHWNISGTAPFLAASRHTIYRKILKHAIVLPD